MVRTPPLAIQLPPLSNLHPQHIVDILTPLHPSTKSNTLFHPYHPHPFFSLITQNHPHHSFSPNFTLTHFFKHLKHITQYYHLLILPSTPHPYPPILHQLSNSTLKPIKQIIF
ncbi:opine metallophore biosynthesis dehydrogenase, partial [Staphylococcus epidermidis]|uniref:opine metallophore biosynthesis dehydrogenase n=1 Tax=Staphylococcus epidermidis TaxID=1282 RepID=UPI0037D9A360